MIRAVLDTNVLASGSIGHEHPESAPALILTQWRASKFELIISEAIRDEFTSALSKPYFVSRFGREQVRDAVDYLVAHSQLVEISESVNDVASHAEDDLILATALSANADYLVTGDRQLQLLGEYRSVKIVSPREFLMLLEET